MDTIGEVHSQMFQYNEDSVMNLFDLPTNEKDLKFEVALLEDSIEIGSSYS